MSAPGRPLIDVDNLVRTSPERPACAHISGWHTRCRNSPIRSGEPRDPPHVTITHAELSRLVGELWPDIARVARVDAGVFPSVTPDGTIWVSVPDGDRSTEAAHRLIDRILDDLERRYLVVDRTEARVLGWATTGTATGPQRLARMPASDSARLAWDTRIDAERQARLREQDWPTPGKREAARRQRRAAR